MTTTKKKVRGATRGRKITANSPRRKNIPKVNPVAQQKRRDRYKKGLAAYRKSECYKIVEARASGRCEHIRSTGPRDPLGPVYVRCTVLRGDFHWLASPKSDSARLTHHHLTYRRFGGRELPADIIVLCDRHNAEAESKHPTRRRWQEHQRRAS